MLTTRELARELGFAARQPDQLEQVGDALFDGRSGGLAVDQAIGHVVSDVQVGKQRVTLKHNAIVAQGRRQQRNVTPVLRQLPGGLDLEPRDDAQQGRLAAARGTQEADKFAFANFQVDVLQRGEAAKFLADVAQVEKRR